MDKKIFLVPGTPSEITTDPMVSDLVRGVQYSRNNSEQQGPVTINSVQICKKCPQCQQNTMEYRDDVPNRQRWYRF